MKRNASLVSYDGSDEDTAAQLVKPSSIVIRSKKLPKLSPAISVSTPIDDPALHEGRVRGSPYVEGQFAAYVYVPVYLETGTKLCDLLHSVVASAKDTVPSLNSDWVNSKTRVEEGEKHPHPVSQAGGTRDHVLHISLSRPIYLRSHQRDELKRVVKDIAKNHRPFITSFSTFATFDNDEHTRTFLAVEVGAGHQQLKALSDAITPFIKTLRQKPFYDEPQFHASFAWALLEHPSRQSASQSPRESGRKDQFPRISSFPPNLVPDLFKMYGAVLAKTGSFDVNSISCKIGKDDFSWTVGARS